MQRPDRDPRRAELAEGIALYPLRDRFHVFHGVGLEPGFPTGAASVLVHLTLAADVRTVS